MNAPKILVAGIGNIFLGDDGFGVEVVRRLAARELPVNVSVRDFGIRALDLSYALLEPFDLILLVDAMQRDSIPGTVYILDPAPAERCAGSMGNAHALSPDGVLAMARSLGANLACVRIVGCQPLTLGDELEGRWGLSPAVEAAIPTAIEAIESLIAEVCGAAAGSADA